MTESNKNGQVFDQTNTITDYCSCIQFAALQLEGRGKVRAPACIASILVPHFSSSVLKTPLGPGWEQGDPESNLPSVKYSQRQEVSLSILCLRKRSDLVGLLRLQS